MFKVQIDKRDTFAYSRYVTNETGQESPPKLQPSSARLPCTASYNTRSGGDLSSSDSCLTSVTRCFLPWYRSVPRQGAKNILPLIDRCTVPAATTSHIRTHAPVSTYNMGVERQKAP